LLARGDLFLVGDEEEEEEEEGLVVLS